MMSYSNENASSKTRSVPASAIAHGSAAASGGGLAGGDGRARGPHANTTTHSHLDISPKTRASAYNCTQITRCGPQLVGTLPNAAGPARAATPAFAVPLVLVQSLQFSLPDNDAIVGDAAPENT